MGSLPSKNVYNKRKKEGLKVKGPHATKIILAERERRKDDKINISFEGHEVS